VTVPRDFRALGVYRTAEALSNEIWRIVGNWPSFARFTMGSQIVKAADSIGANLAEGSGRGSYADNRRFVQIARGSLKETQHFLRLAYRRDLLTTGEVERLAGIIDKLGPSLNAYLRSLSERSPLEPKD
jgi:four helix bundle protein